jgi:hypothetical protein
MYTIHFDEWGYFNISTQILSSGLFSLSEELRTYMYPWILAMFRLLNVGDETYTKAIFSLFQYIVYIFTILLIANVSWRIKPSKIAAFSIFFIGVLNPYLIQSTTYYLTDLLSSCFIIISIIFAARANLHKGFNFFITIGLLFINLMIRPANAIFFPAVFIVLLIRLWRKEFKLTLKLILIGIAQLFFLLPQLYNNVVHLHKWTPLLAKDLYSTQAIWGAQYLKYATVLREGEDPQLFYNNPYHLYVPGDTTTIYQLMFDNLHVFLLTISAHLFGVVDWGYVDAFITDYYPISRIFGSIFLYLSWIMILLGIIICGKDTIINTFKGPNNSSGLFTYFTLLLVASFYLCFISTTLVESRFGYPIFLILLLFSGRGVEFLILSIRMRKQPFIRLSLVVIYLAACTIIVLFLLWVSFKLDFYTGRIDWRTIFPFLP